MKTIIKILGTSLLTFIFLAGCDQLKMEDEKIKDALIGKFFLDDEVDEDGTKTKDVKGEFFSDGKFYVEWADEIVDDETFETTDFLYEIGGEWKVKDKFIYYTYDLDKLKITPELNNVELDEMIKAIKDYNTPDKVVHYDASKIIYEDSDGKRQTIKKSY
jgi:hypothetical protein